MQSVPTDPNDSRRLTRRAHEGVREPEAEKHHAPRDLLSIGFKRPEDSLQHDLGGPDLADDQSPEWDACKPAQSRVTGTVHLMIVPLPGALVILSAPPIARARYFMF